MTGETAPHRPAARLAVAVAVAWLAGPGGAQAFPVFDPVAEGVAVPAGAELAAPDAQDLRHQLQIAGGLTKGAGGWAILPRLDLQEAFTDNVLQASRPRRWDFITYASPGISVLGDTSRVQVRLDYAPTLALNARTGSQNALSQQLNGTGLITIVPELAYVDVRALAGVQSRTGGLGGIGGIGAAGGGPITAGSLIGGAGNGGGLNKQNQVQTTSFGVSPYLVHRFGDYGTGRLGYSVNLSRFSSTSGFAASPFPVGGTNGQTLLTTEQMAHFVSGDFLGAFQNAVDIDLSQSTNSVDNGATGFTTPGVNNRRTTSSRQIFTDKLSYALSRSVTLFGTIGHESIHYSGGNFRQIDGITWTVGTTLVPNPDSQITVSYGRQQGADSLFVDGQYALTARTTIGVNYANTLGTQLENLQRQLNLAAVSNSGSLVNAQTGGPLFVGNNALGVQPGLYRFSTLNLTVRTVLDRDLLSLGLALTDQSAAASTTGIANGTSSTGRSVTAQWIHQLRPELALNTSFAYSVQTTKGLTGGDDRSLAATIALQYTMNETLASTLRYSFFDRQSPLAGFSMYQNLVILGISKQF